MISIHYHWAIHNDPIGTLLWVGPSQTQDSACLASVLTPLIPLSEKAPGKQSDYATSEPFWIAIVKQKQKNSQTQVPTKELKTKNSAGAKTGTKVPRYEVRSGKAHKTLPKLHWKLCQAYISPLLRFH